MSIDHYIISMARKLAKLKKNSLKKEAMPQKRQATAQSYIREEARISFSTPDAFCICEMKYHCQPGDYII